jgi:hypothetical protein
MASKKPPLGSGKRFDAMVEDLKKKGHSDDSAKAIAANAGRQKYGDAAMQKMAARGAKRAAKGR